MRSIGKFSDEIHFPSGFQLAEAFTADESYILEVYGLTMKGLQEGTLMPVSAEEYLFLADLDGEFGVASDIAKCWQKYLKKVARYDRQTAKVKKSKRSSAVAVSSNYFDDDEELVLDIDDDQDLD